MTHAWRAVVVDDNPVVLKIAALLLNLIPGVEVVGEANSGQGALDAVARLRPDLVLLDLSMPGMDGLEATRRLVSRPNAPAVLIMSYNDLPEYAEAAEAAGAGGFLSKSALVEQLPPLVRRALSGRDVAGDGGRDPGHDPDRPAHQRPPEDRRETAVGPGADP